MPQDLTTVSLLINPTDRPPGGRWQAMLWATCHQTTLAEIERKVADGAHDFGDVGIWVARDSALFRSYQVPGVEGTWYRIPGNSDGGDFDLADLIAWFEEFTDLAQIEHVWALAQALAAGLNAQTPTVAVERSIDRPLTPFWVSWYAEKHFGFFELSSPWWVSGERIADGARTTCAAVLAADENAARELIYAVYDTRPDHIDFRFVEGAGGGLEPLLGSVPARGLDAMAGREDAGARVLEVSPMMSDSLIIPAEYADMVLTVLHESTRDLGGDDEAEALLRTLGRYHDAHRFDPRLAPDIDCPPSCSGHRPFRSFADTVLNADPKIAPVDDELWQACLAKVAEVENVHKQAGTYRGGSRSTAYWGIRSGPVQAGCLVILGVGQPDGTDEVHTIEVTRTRVPGGPVKVTVTDRVSVDSHDELWEQRIREFDPTRKAIIGAEFYSIGDEAMRGTRDCRGHGGRKFVIVFTDGRRVVTTNLWYGGTVPPKFRDRLPDSAVFEAASTLAVSLEFPQEA
jgi:hypothetical protein